MKSMIKEFYNKICYDEKHGIDNNPEYGTINLKIKQERDYLMSKLPPDEHQHLDKLESLYTSASGIDEVESFCKGFKLAALLISEVHG